MGQSEIDAVRALLGAKPRPVGWAERRWRVDEVGAAWPVAEDVKLEAVELGGVPGTASCSNDRSAISACFGQVDAQTARQLGAFPPPLAGEG